MSLVTILGICATFFTILILLVHGTIIGVQTYKRQQQMKRDKKANLQQLLTDICSADDNVVKEAQKKITQLLIADKLQHKGSII